MRNLKKFLALVMAMVMALSLMVSANAATTNVSYKDSDQVEPVFAEAVTVLSGMGVYHGDEYGFRPGSSITRGEVAAVIYRLATGDVNDTRSGLYTVYSPFTDVAESDWFAGYVGYLWDAQIIKGTTATTYNPYDEVTGYEVLAMILRAIGYDKDHEFEGAQWIVNVSALATDLGILKDVKTTHYGDTLYLASRRDVVASLLFRAAADVATVNYTPMAGYNKYNSVVATATAANLNPTLGWKNFGLTDDEGVVVGNQETGETNTRLSITNELADPYCQPVYSYIELGQNLKAATAATATNYNDITPANRNLNWIVTFDWETGLDQFAHKVNVWFDGRGSYASTASAIDNNNLKTYAMFDRSTNSAVVKLKDVNDTKALKVNAAPATASNNSLYSLAKDNGFSVGSATTVYANTGFERFLPDLGGSNDTLQKVDELVGTTETSSSFKKSPEGLYLLISNSGDKALDVVITLNIQVTEVTGIDNVNANKTVTVPFRDDADTNLFDTTGWEFIDDDNRLAGTIQTTLNSGTLEQKQVSFTDDAELGDYEIGVRVTGTAALGGTPRLPGGALDSTAAANVGTIAAKNGAGVTNNDAAYEYDRYDSDGIGTGTDYDIGRFLMKEVTKTVTGKVIGYNDKGVTLDNGTTYEKSMLYDAVVENTLPQETQYDNGTYILYLTDGGKLLGAEHTYGAKFLYGTYVDYETKVASSTFDYSMVYVDLDGKTDVATISKLTRSKQDATYSPYTTENINGTDVPGTPYRDTKNATAAATGSTNGIGLGQYRGFALDDKTINWSFESLANLGVVAGANKTAGITNNKGDGTDYLWTPLVDDDSPNVVFNGTNDADGAEHTITIGSDQVGLGAAYAGKLDVDGVNGTKSADDLYFTENTTFILVSGYGTDSVKAETIKGIKALKGDDDKVYIDLHYTVANSSTATAHGTAAGGTVKLANVKDNTVMSDMTYLTQSPFVYAQNRVLSRQADVIILPAAAVGRTTSSDVYYVGSVEPTLVNATGEDATRFTMYQKGEAKQVWIKGLVTAADDVAHLNFTTKTIASGVSHADTLHDTGNDRFYKLSDTGKKASDGGAIYEIVELTNWLWTQNRYVASTYSAQTGSFEGNGDGNFADGTSGDHSGTPVMKNVSGAKIVNLNALNTGADIVWPGITDLTTLNYAGSLGLYGVDEYGGNTPLYVSAVVDGLNVTELYVCYDQTNLTWS